MVKKTAKRKSLSISKGRSKSTSNSLSSKTSSSKTTSSNRTSSKTSSMSTICNYQVMKHSLYEWYHHMFEQLGWMILAKSKGDMESKILAYKHSLQHLKQQIECKHAVIRDLDKKDDLKIMLQNVDVLISHVDGDL
jgi:hypothetical protein